MKDIPNIYTQSFTAYFLNVFLGSSNQIKALDYFVLNGVSNNEFKFVKPELVPKNNNVESIPVNNNINSKVNTINEKENQNSKNNEDNKKKKKRRKNKGGNKNELNIDLKFYLTENLIGTNVNLLIETSNELSLFLKSSEVSFKIININII